MTIRVEGLSDLDRALQGLKPFTARRVGKRAMAKALQPVEDAARSLAPRSSDGGGDGRNMADSIGVGSKLTRAQAREARRAEREGRHVMLMYVGPREAHAHLVEFGTSERRQRSGKSVGAMPARPFMRPAWDSNRDAVLSTLSDELRIELDKAVARAARRAGRA